MNLKKQIIRFPWEAVFWLTSLVLLALFAGQGQGHATLCPLALSGMESCPGCGIGRAIGLFLRGEIAASVQMHLLGIPAALILAYRSMVLLRAHFRN